MLTIKKVLFFFFTTLTLHSLAQNVTNTGAKNKEAIVTCRYTIKMSGHQMTQLDTLLIRDSCVLEPVYTEFQHLETHLSTGITKLISSGQKLQWYYITDLSKKMGMAFNIEKQHLPESIRAYTLMSKNLGYGLAAEPFCSKAGYMIDDYSKGKDTIYNGQKCFIVKANRKIPVTNKSSHNVLLFTKVIINPGITDQHYSFISDIIAQHFGGAIVYAESYYENGEDFYVEYEYKAKLTPAYSALFDKYQSLYLANIKLLDQVKD